MEDHKTLYIADASVLIKWALEEAPNIKEALALREDFLENRVKLQVPSHCFAEICNLLGRQHGQLLCSFFSFLATSEIEEYCLTFNVVNTAFQIMKKFKEVSFYDASYHALAIQHRGIFITSDCKYFSKVDREGSIMLLKDYGKKR